MPTFKLNSRFEIFLVLCIFCLLFKTGFLYAASEEGTKGTMFAGVWYPSANAAKGSFDNSFQEIGIEELSSIAMEEIRKSPKFKKALNILLCDKIQDDSVKRKIMTLVISRATDSVYKYSVKNISLYQHFFNITVSLIVISPLTGQIDYTRILTGEIPDLEKKMISSETKKKRFITTFRKTLQSLFKKTEDEFKINDIEHAAYNFQVTNFKIKDEAKKLNGFQNDLKQFLHDTLVMWADKNNLKLYFLPPSTQWEKRSWEDFKECFGIEAGEKPFDESEDLLKEGKLLTISGVLAKLSKLRVKGNEIDAYYLYVSHVAGAVVERDQNGKKVCLRPKKTAKGKQIVKNNGRKEYHDIKGLKSTYGTASSLSLYLDATHNAIYCLSQELINNCKNAYGEKINEY